VPSPCSRKGTKRSYPLDPEGYTTYVRFSLSSYGGVRRLCGRLLRVRKTSSLALGVEGVVCEENEFMNLT
jgi:hypothetical protein